MAEDKATKEVNSKVEEAPDPDEDDLDDLDEMLNEFSAAKISDSKVQQSKAEAKFQEPMTADTAKEAMQNDPEATPGADDEFTKQLQQGMAEMMRELETNPDMAKEFEQIMMGQFGSLENASKTSDSTSSPAPTKDSPQPSPAPSGTQQLNGQSDAPSSFQDTIRQTMNRMKESNATASAASAEPGENPDDFMTAMLNEIAQSQGGADGNSEDAFSNMLLGMMEQLTNKEILYEPMKDLSGKFPGWIAEREPGQLKASSISDEERNNYKEQSTLVKEIVERFEQPGYSDQNSGDREFIVERMQKMQAAGAPPADLVGDMGGAAEMLGGLDSQCPQQ